MSQNIEKLLDRAKRVQMTPAEREKQRRSFVYGNTKIENERITRELVDQVADALEADKARDK